MEWFDAFIVVFASGIRLAIPLILACLAGLWPERSDHNPARQPRMSGIASLMPEAKTTMKASNHSMGAGPQIGGCVVRRASRVATGRRNMCSSAPANSTTRPWMTTIMSRLIFGFSNASSAPPW